MSLKVLKMLALEKTRVNIIPVFYLVGLYRTLTMKLTTVIIEYY